MPIWGSLSSDAVQPSTLGSLGGVRAVYAVTELSVIDVEYNITYVLVLDI